MPTLRETFLVHVYGLLNEFHGNNEGSNLSIFLRLARLYYLDIEKGYEFVDMIFIFGFRLVVMAVATCSIPIYCVARRGNYGVGQKYMSQKGSKT